MNRVARFEAHTSYVLDLLFTADSQMLISAGMDNVAKIWSVPDWTLMRVLEGHDKSVNSMSLSPDGRVLATGSTDATVRLWSLPEGELLRTLRDRKKTVACVRISADGEYVAAGSYGGRAALWTLSGDEVVGIKASSKNLSSVAFSPDGRTLATAGFGDDVQLWSLPSGQHLRTLAGHRTAVGALTFIKNGRFLVSMGYEQAIKFRNAETWREDRTVSSDLAGARGFVLSPNEETAALSLKSRVQLWNVEDWTPRAELQVGTKVVNGMAFSPDGRWFAAGAADRKIRVWER